MGYKITVFGEMLVLSLYEVLVKRSNWSIRCVSLYRLTIDHLIMVQTVNYFDFYVLRQVNYLGCEGKKNMEFAIIVSFF